MTETEIKQLIASYDEVSVDSRSTANLTIYSLRGRIMAVVKSGASPVNLSLRCDSALGQLLRQRYESISSDQQLNRRHFINVLLTGQLSDDEVSDQIRHAYQQTLIS